MCYNPSTLNLSSGAVQKISCGKCGRCIQRHINDYVGRSLAEASLSRAALCITLSYRNDFDGGRYDLADKVINPHHFQLFMKRLRKGGHKCKYLVAGEYGELKGRAHFHALIFFRDKVPEWPELPVGDDGKPARVHIDQWPHGHVTIDWHIDHRAARYVCKYLHKDLQKGTGQRWLSVSKKPPLGAEWFAHKAANHIRQGVFPTSFQYNPPGAKPGQKHLMQGAIRRDFIAAILEGWNGMPPLDRADEWVRHAVERYWLQCQKRDAERLYKEEPERVAEMQTAEITGRHGPDIEPMALERLDQRKEARLRLDAWIAYNGDDPVNLELIEWLRENGNSEEADRRVRMIRDFQREEKRAWSRRLRRDDH